MESFDTKIKKRRCKCCTAVVTISVLVVFAVLFICLGAGSIPFLEDFYETTVKKQLVMVPGNEAYNNWDDPPTTVYMQFFLFNYTNADEVINKNAKPRVQQLGPYSYREIRDNVILEQNEFQITYLENYSYVFDPTTSCLGCSEHDKLVTPNIPVLTVLDQLKNMYYPKEWYKDRLFDFLNYALNKDKTYTLFMELDVKRLLWGFDSPFLHQLENIIDEIPVFLRKLFHLPKLDPFIALQQNGTKGAIANGNLTILTGKSNIDDVQKIIKWRGISEAPYWLTKFGRMINGTDGTHTKPFLGRDDTIYIFNPQLCRSLYLNYETPDSQFDIPLYRFSTEAKLFENNTYNPDNYAFCKDAKDCYPSGLLYVGKCQPQNPPVFMSSPHFYQGYPELYEAIDGLHPQKKLHETYLSIEPTTGIVMDAHKRLQININAQHVPKLSLTKCLKSQDNFLPVLYIHEYATIDKKSAEKFKKEVLGPKKLLKYLEYGVIGFGGLLFIIALILGAQYQRKKIKKKDYSPFKNEDEVVNQNAEDLVPT